MKEAAGTGPLRVGIVGAGLMGRWHAMAARRAGARVVAVADPAIERARTLAARHPGARATASLDETLAEGPSVLHLCTPTGTHVGLAERCVSEGVHALIEKPLAPDADTTRRLLESADEAEVLLAPVHQFVFQRGVRQALRSPSRLGRVVHADMTVCSAGGEGSDAPTVREIASGILPHPLSLFERCLPGGIAAMEWSASSPGAGELRATGVGPEVTATLLVSMAGRPPVNELRLIGTAGSAYLDLFHGFARFAPGTVSRREKALRPFKDAGRSLAAAGANLAARAAGRQPAYPGLWELVAAFYEAVGGRASGPFSDREVLRVAEARDRIIRLAVREGNFRS